MEEVLRSLLNSADRFSNELVSLPFSSGSLRLYPRSVHSIDSDLLFIARMDTEKRACLLTKAESPGALASELTQTDSHTVEEGILYTAPLNVENAYTLQGYLPFTKAILLGTADSFGFGDRLGIANPAHLRSLQGGRFRPILCQQSIRELTRTQREPVDVMAAAIWAVIQEGYHEGFGADADHLKTVEDVDRMVAAGYTFFTIDPSDHVDNRADSLPEDELAKGFADLPWQELDGTASDTVSRYAGQTISLPGGYELKASEKDVHAAGVKYGRAIVHVASLFRHMADKHKGHPAEFEMSVDETDAVTTPFEHYFIAAELKRLGVELVSLAPRFVGDFEKGIDYKGDLKVFELEYRKHLAVTEALGGYKLSIHSGSDKFSAYRVIGEIGQGAVHVKTAGTSYLEALRTVAEAAPPLFREIFDFARSHYEIERRTYHVSGRLENIPPTDQLVDSDLLGLLDNVDARQIMHVTFGKVLLEKLDSGEDRFKSRLMKVLNDHEGLHYSFLVRHFRKHLDPFGG